jgi:hypothetical protein
VELSPAIICFNNFRGQAFVCCFRCRASAEGSVDAVLLRDVIGGWNEIRSAVSTLTDQKTGVQKQWLLSSGPSCF